MNARDSTLYPSLAARNEYVRFLLGMSEWMRGREGGGMGERKAGGGNRGAACNGGRERDDDHDSKTKVGTSFVRLY